MKLREIQRRLASEMHMNVNMIRCRKAKKMVKDKLAGNFIDGFAMLWDYADELILKNPGSTIKMTVNRITPESPSHFKRFYVCFKVLKRGWKKGCKPILGLDGCFLKGPLMSEMLFAIRRDGNNQMHVLSNLSGWKKANAYEFSFWKIVKFTTEREWERNKEELYNIDEGVTNELFFKNLKVWTNTFRGLHSMSDIVDNNLCKAFNSNIMESRFKSIIITMLEEIIVKMMTRIMDKGK
ncbi:hypothetical protein Goarm_005183 [Gossypium armourianum]|uniref:Uncharacterized protein n=1 Tax=Gossypium armourianum TaxID=34283 RepID=A0A7J9JZD6_9ROSI|nr:hypothetical protein [Gossypium armourianum]